MSKKCNPIFSKQRLANTAASAPVELSTTTDRSNSSSNNAYGEANCQWETKAEKAIENSSQRDSSKFADAAIEDTCHYSEVAADAASVAVAHVGGLFLRLIHFNDVYDVYPTAEGLGGAAHFSTAVRQFREVNTVYNKSKKAPLEGGRRFMEGHEETNERRWVGALNTKLKEDEIDQGEEREELKEDREGETEKALVFFSGDIFSPSDLSSASVGSHMAELLNLLEVHTACYGNHDLDWGWQRLETLAGTTCCKWVVSNASSHSSYSGVIANAQKFRIFEWGHARILTGIMGLIENDWVDLLSPPERADIIYEDFVQAARRFVRLFKERGCQLVVALTHMRWNNDELLARQVEGIDLILGGHDHEYGMRVVNGTLIVKSGTDFRDFSALTLVPKDSYFKETPITAKSRATAAAAGLAVAAEVKNNPFLQSEKITDGDDSFTACLTQSSSSSISLRSSPSDRSVAQTHASTGESEICELWDASPSTYTEQFSSGLKLWSTFDSSLSVEGPEQQINSAFLALNCAKRCCGDTAPCNGCKIHHGKEREEELTRTNAPSEPSASSGKGILGVDDGYKTRNAPNGQFISSGRWWVWCERVSVTASAFEADTRVSSMIRRCARNFYSKKSSAIVGVWPVTLETRFRELRTRECNAGQWLTDLMREYAAVDIAFFCAGGIRSDCLFKKGQQVPEHVIENSLHIARRLQAFRVRGSAIPEILENSVSKWPQHEGRFLQVSGLRFEFCGNERVGHRVVRKSIEVWNNHACVWEALDEEKMYSAITSVFALDGGDGYSMLAICERVGETLDITTLVKLWLRRKSPITEGRSEIESNENDSECGEWIHRVHLLEESECEWRIRRTATSAKH